MVTKERGERGMRRREGRREGEHKTYGRNILQKDKFNLHEIIQEEQKKEPSPCHS